MTWENHDQDQSTTTPTPEIANHDSRMAVGLVEPGKAVTFSSWLETQLQRLVEEQSR